MIEFPNHCKGKVNSSPKQWSFFFFRRWIGKIKSHLLNELENLWCTYLNLRYYRYLLKKLQNFFKRIYLHSVTATPFFYINGSGSEHQVFWQVFKDLCNNSITKDMLSCSNLRHDLVNLDLVKYPINWINCSSLFHILLFIQTRFSE